MESILTSVKKLLGIDETYIHFDQDIIVHINSVFGILHQMGVGPENPVTIIDKTNVWNEFGEVYEMVKTYVYLKVKLVFDPPANPTIVEALKQNASEIEWRLYIDSDYHNLKKEG